MNPARYAAGWIEVKVTGAAPERFLEAMADRGAAFWDAAPPRDFTLYLKTGTGTEKQLDRLAAASGCEAEVLSVHGFPALLRKMRRRASLWIPAAAFLLLLAWSLPRVWDIRVEGNETVPEGVILNALEDCGVYPGARWTAFRQDQIRNSMLLRLPELRWLTVTVQGCRARVIVRERGDKPEPVPESEYARVVSDRAGLVTEVRALRGTAETAPGQMLLPGETVIGGYASGRFGVIGPVRAIGGAELRTWHEITMEAPAEAWVKGPTGERTTLWSVVFGKKRVNIFKGSSICPGDCDKIIVSYDLALPGVFRLPVSVEKTLIAGRDIIRRPAGDLREEMEQALTEELLSRMGEGGEVLSSVFTASEAGGLLYVTLRAECLETAGVTEPLTEQELLEIRAKIPNTEDTAQ
ncbi:MAG: sporulation protein YqfD [Oscillospiraceae bacterium]|nr:sporulation protein YqfD [Oscillospiraceae bacterium]